MLPPFAIFSVMESDQEQKETNRSEFLKPKISYLGFFFLRHCLLVCFFLSQKNLSLNHR